MKIQAGQTVLLTGASGGLGVFIARAFARLGPRLALVAYPGSGLGTLRQEVEQLGAQARSWELDLRDPLQRHQLLREARREFGQIDILVNNAGVECMSAYHDLSEESICAMLAVNLEAPMILSRLVLPEMLERKQGHIVNISSLAGKSGPAFQEPYAAAKAALVAFSFSLRATYRRAGVSASVIVPGFVEAGMYAKLKKTAGCSAPALLCTSSPQIVGRAVLRAIDRDLAEVFVNPTPIRPLLAFATLFPRIGEWVSNRIGTDEFFRRVVEAQNRSRV
jgi:NAD(P)-dependent dehydrogenase (short-subunit alcohol dehydrogenase family)